MKKVTTFDNYPYYDDFDTDKNYYRILFKPGYSVQTRELNQLQTILQQQISYLSDYSLQDKTAVMGGNINFNKNVDFLKLKNGTNLSRRIADYNNTVKFEADDGINGTIQFVLPQDSTGPTTIYVNYKSAGMISGNHIPPRNSLITLYFTDGNTETIQLEDSNSYFGKGTVVSLDDSIYYIHKTFVKVNRQVVVLEKYNQGNLADYNIGILITEDVVTAAQDFSLYDNAYGTPNEAAEGADRYRITGVLIDKSDVPPDMYDKFIEMIRLDKGEVAVKPKEENSVIPLLQQILARRTYDESGDYIVDMFNLDIREHLKENENNGVYEKPKGDNNLLVAQLDPGVAYIRGFEVRLKDITRLDFEKARETGNIENTVTQLNYSNYIIVTPTTGDITIGGRINFLDSLNKSIGSAFVAGVEVVNETQLKLYIINISMSSGFDSIKKVNAAAGVSSMIAFTSTLVSYRIANVYSPLVYSLPYGFSKSTILNSLAIYKTYTTIATSGIITLSNEDNTEIFSLNASEYYVYPEGQTTGKPVSIQSSAGNTVKLDITNLLSSSVGQRNVKVVAKIFSTAPKTKTKILTGENGLHKDIVAVSASKNGVFTLSKCDGYRLIKALDPDGNDISSKFNFDTGSRDSHYQKAAAVLKSGQKLDDKISIAFYYSYFEHSSVGDFFTVDSYVGLDYPNIPNYTDSSGKNIFLGSAYDFRKIITGDNIDQTSRGHVVLSDRVISNITYYLPRYDRIMVTSSSSIVHVKGVPSFNPVLPEELSDAVTLYELKVLPYTFSINDVISKKLNHKRYTMKDIGKLENRIKNVEEIALLNRLESDTASINFTDRFKSGYIVDNFSTSNTGDIHSPHFGVAYDLNDASIRPKFVSDFIDVKLNKDESTNIKYHENTGMITLDYTVEEYIKQDLASDIVKLQPYISHGWGTGTVILNPSNDVWKEYYQFTENLYSSTSNRLDDIIITTSQNVNVLPPKK